MPIASPDAFNEVPVNNTDNEDDISVVDQNLNFSLETVNSKTIVKNVIVNNAISQKKMNEQAISHNTVHTMSTMYSGQSCDNTSSTCTNLTDENNPSLKNLIHCIKTSYNNKFKTPKWKNFKGLKLQVIEKIRLNNIIWRTWFEQCKILLILNFLSF